MLRKQHQLYGTSTHYYHSHISSSLSSCLDVDVLNTHFGYLPKYFIAVLGSTRLTYNTGGHKTSSINCADDDLLFDPRVNTFPRIRYVIVIYQITYHMQPVTGSYTFQPE